MKKLVPILCLLLLAPVACCFAQKRTVQNRPYTDYRLLHYGFFFGMNFQDLEFENNGFTTETGENWFADVPSYTPGFSVGLLADFLIAPHLNLRVVPTMHFGQKQITYREVNTGATDKQTVNSTYISLPIDIKYSAQRFNNYRPYMMAGINPMIDLTSKKQKQLLFERLDCFVEAGMGCDFYFPFFKWIPEIKFCYSLRNILNKNRDDLTDPTYLKFTNSVNAATTKMIVLSFYFE